MDPSILAAWRAVADAESARFDPDALGREVLAFLHSFRDGCDSPLADRPGQRVDSRAIPAPHHDAG